MKHETISNHIEPSSIIGIVYLDWFTLISLVLNTMWFHGHISNWCGLHRPELHGPRLTQGPEKQTVLQDLCRKRCIRWFRDAQNGSSNFNVPSNKVCWLRCTFDPCGSIRVDSSTRMPKSRSLPAKWYKNTHDPTKKKNTWKNCPATSFRLKSHDQIISNLYQNHSK